MQRRESVFIVLLFAGSLLSAAVAGLLGVRSEAFENRAVATFPPIRAKYILDAGLYARISSYLEDHLPLRQAAVELDARLDVGLFQDSPHSKVRMGEDDWLFFETSLIQPARTERPVSELIDLLADLGRRFEESGRAFRVVLIPNKLSVYPEYATPRIRELGSGGTRKRQELDRELQSRSLPAFLDLAPLMLATKQEYDHFLFFPDDTHITSFGAIIIARATTDAIRPGLWANAVVMGPRDEERLGDLGQMMIVREPIANAVFRIRREGVRLEQPEKRSQTKGYRLEILRAASDDQPLIEGRTFFLHDSSLDLPRIMMHPFFEEAHYLNWNSFDPPTTAEMMAESDRVVIELIERDFYWRTDELLGSESFQAAIREALRPSAATDGGG